MLQSASLLKQGGKGSMANCMALPIPAQSQGVSRMETNATETLWGTGRVQSPRLSLSNHLGTVESGNGRT